MPTAIGTTTTAAGESPPPLRRVALQLLRSPYLDLKDPCPVHDGRQWHLFGTAATGVNYECEIFHAIADGLAGPWRFLPGVDVSTLRGGCLASPGVIAEGSRLHMFVQTEYNVLDGRIEHLISDDGGARFAHARTALTSVGGTEEAGIYDPHPAEVCGEKYLVYSAFAVVGQPDLHVARSTSGTWDGPWERLGPALRHEDVWCHNQRDHEAYEWGLEGGQLVQLPDGRVLLNAVCFLPGAAPGTRQRVFFAVGDEVLGRYKVLGPVLPPQGPALAGENGHASALVVGDEIALFFQERSLVDRKWQLGLATAPVAQDEGDKTEAESGSLEVPTT